MISKHYIHLLFIGFLLLTGCASVPQTTGSLGTGDYRRVVIVGENINSNIARYYQNKFDALVWFTPFEGKFVNKANNFLQSGIGPSVAMRSLIRELKSINYSVGQWTFIVPKIAENYFLATLKSMEGGSLTKARGIVVLIDSSSNKDIEVQLKRVTKENFFVTHDFHK